MKGHYIILRCKKGKTYQIQIYTLIQRILNINIILKTELFLLGLIDKQLEKKTLEIILIYDYSSEVTICKKWKDLSLPTIEEWLMKLREFAKRKILGCISCHRLTITAFQYIFVKCKPVQSWQAPFLQSSMEHLIATLANFLKGKILSFQRNSFRKL